MAQHPSRIDLLELDIDLRLADLWREAAGITEWSLDVVAAFMRAAYGKGYCDALTEDAPGSLCADHGYRVPARKHDRARVDALGPARPSATLPPCQRAALRGSSSPSRSRACSPSSCSTRPSPATRRRR